MRTLFLIIFIIGCNSPTPSISLYGEKSPTYQVMWKLAEDTSNMQDKPSCDQWGTALRVKLISTDNPTPTEPVLELVNSVRKSQGDVVVKDFRKTKICNIIVTSAGPDKKFNTDDDIQVQYHVNLCKVEADIYDNGEKVGSITVLEK